MIAKILKENGQVLHLSTYWPLNETELLDAVELSEQSALDKNIAMVIRQPMTQEKLKLLDGDPNFPLISWCGGGHLGWSWGWGGNIEGERNHTGRTGQLHWCPSRPSKMRRDDVRHCEMESKIFRWTGNRKGKWQPNPWHKEIYHLVPWWIWICTHGKQDHREHVHPVWHSQ